MIAGSAFATLILMMSAGILSPHEAAADRLRYQKSVSLKVGETRNVYAVRHRDCESMPSYASVEDPLPETSLGRFSDGGETTGKSCACDAVEPTRAIAFTAERIGEETLKFFGCKVTVTVE